MDKSSFIKLLKKEGFYVDDSKALPTVLCPPGDYNTVIKAVKKIKASSEYDESFSIKICSDLAISAPLKEDGEDVATDRQQAESEPSEVVSEALDENTTSDDVPTESITESSGNADSIDSAIPAMQNDFFSVFDAFD